jgi:hypothetical protein
VKPGQDHRPICLFLFAEQSGRPLTSLLLMGWEDDAAKKGFIAFMCKVYPGKDMDDALTAIDKCIMNH